MADDWDRYAASLQKINEGPDARQKRREQTERAIAKASADAERLKRQADAEHASVSKDLTALRTAVSEYLGRAGLPHALPGQRAARVPATDHNDLPEAIAKTRDSALRVKPRYEAYVQALEHARSPAPQRFRLATPLKVVLGVIGAYLALNILSVLF